MHPCADWLLCIPFPLLCILIQFIRKIYINFSFGEIQCFINDLHILKISGLPLAQKVTCILGGVLYCLCVKCYTFCFICAFLSLFLYICFALNMIGSSFYSNVSKLCLEYKLNFLSLPNTLWVHYQNMLKITQGLGSIEI